MKILIKAYYETYGVATRRANGLPDKICYVSAYWNYMLRDIMRRLGHQVEFIGERAVSGEIITDHRGYDMLLFHEIESFSNDPDYSLRLLTEFKGIKCFYVPTVHGQHRQIVERFDIIFPADVPDYVYRWKTIFPAGKKICLLPWHAPERELTMTNVENFRMDPDDKFKIIYCGVVLERYLDMLMHLADRGETIYVGGTFDKRGDPYIREFTPKEISSLHPNIKLLSESGMFNFGDQFKYLRQADLGLVFYPINWSGCLKHKLTEYLVCGLPVAVESPCPNGFRVAEMDAGRMFDFDNFEQIYEIVQAEKHTRRDRKAIEEKAWTAFDPEIVCRRLIEEVMRA